MPTQRRTRISFAALCIVGLAVVLMTQFPIGADEPEAKKSAATPSSDAKPTPPLVQSFDKAEEVKYSWGWIRWLMSSKIDPQAEMTFGIVYVKPHQRNPMHVHPNCEEHLHVLSGSCEHLVGKKWLALKAGDTVRIPAGVQHAARTLDEPMRAVIVYSSGDRQFKLVEEEQAK